MSEIRVNNVIGEDGATPVNFSKGINISSGVVTATTFKGALTGNATGLSGNPSINTTGIITATTFKGDGSELSGIVGFATAISQDVSHFASDFYTAAHSRQVPANTQYTVQGNAYAGNTVFTKLGQVHVAVGATFHVANGTNFVMDSLNIFE